MNAILIFFILICKMIIVNSNDKYYLNYYTFINVPEKPSVYKTYDKSDIWKDGFKKLKTTTLEEVSQICFDLSV